MNDKEELLHRNRELRLHLDAIRRRRRKLKELHDKHDATVALWQRHLNEARLRQEQAVAEYRSILERKKRLHFQLELSQQWNVLSDCFQIWHQGPFATINGLRLGAEAHGVASHEELKVGTLQDDRRVRALTGNHGNTSNGQAIVSTPIVIRISWNEINASLGYLVLLLATLETKPFSGIKYKTQLLCQGSTSKIGLRRGESVTFYNLFSDDGFQFFGKRSFNIALQLIAQCVLEAGNAIQERDRTITMPYVIEKNSRGEYSVGGTPIVFGGDGVEWTCAMKYLLTDVKHLIAFRALGL